MSRGRLVTATMTTRLDHGRIIMGGVPFTVMRLSKSGAETLTRWLSGEQPDWSNENQQQLARRLIDTGLCLEVPLADADDLGWAATVVIPVRNDAAGLADTLFGLDGSGLAIIVVDDGSTSPVQQSSLPDHAKLIRNEQSLGPGGARQKALEMVDTPLVMFIDAGVQMSPQDVADLEKYLQLDNVVGAAPRIRSLPGTHLTARYEKTRSPLDMGRSSGLIGPGKPVPYVPTACLMVSMAALTTVEGFNPSLRFGEDVDLVWRMRSQGSIHYVSTVEVYHPPRERLRDLIRQRVDYGSSAAPLSVHHGENVAPMRVSPTTDLANLLLLARRPWIALALFGASIPRIARRLDSIPDANVHAGVLSLKSQWHSLLSLLTASTRSWWPLLAISALLVPASRRSAARIFALGLARRLVDGPREPANAAVDLALGAVDDVSYGLGVWIGAVRHRTIKPLLPALSSARKRPGRQE